MSMTLELPRIDRTEQEIKTYGCTQTELQLLLERSIRQIGARMMTMRLLSQAQELFDAGQSESAKLTINRAKWVIAQALPLES